MKRLVIALALAIVAGACAEKTVPLPNESATKFQDFVEPTILTNCEPNMVACREETFGPLAVVIRVGNDEEALRVANETRYGLGGAIWSSNSDRAESMARRMETGGVFINGMTHSAPGIPFGGIKDSGYGRELSSFGVREFVNVKTLWR